MTDLMRPPPEQDLPPSRAADIRGAVLRSAGETRRPSRRRALWLAGPAVAMLAVLAVIGVRLVPAPELVGAPAPTPAVATSSGRDPGVETDAGALSEAEALAVVDGLDRLPGFQPAALAEVVVARRLTTALGDGTFVVWTDVEGSTWYAAEIPGEMKRRGPISGPGAKKAPRTPDADEPVTRLTDLELFGWRMDADRPDATARDLHSENVYLTTASVDRVEVRMTVEGEPGPWFSAPVHEGYAFVPAVTTGAHSTTEDVDKVTRIEDRAFDAAGNRLTIRAR